MACIIFLLSISDLKTGIAEAWGQIQDLSYFL